MKFVPVSPDHWRDSSRFAAAANDAAAIKEITERYGFCVVKGVFAAHELTRMLEAMRAATLKFPDAAEPDLLSVPSLRWLLFDDRVLAIARNLLGEKLVYYGEANLNYEAEAGEYARNPLMKLHADAMGRPDNLNSYWKPDPVSREIYPSYRFAVYFGDYARHSGGLKVVPESHLMNHGELRKDPSQIHKLDLGGGVVAGMPVLSYGMHNIGSEPGDLVIWNLHTMHSAGALRLKAWPDAALLPQVEKQLWLKAPEVYEPGPGPRNAIFFDLGRPSPEVDLYIKCRALYKNRIFEKPIHRSSTYDDPDVIAQAAHHGVELRFDAIIVSLALTLIDATWRAGGSLDVLEAPVMMSLRRRLMSLCEINADFSPHFCMVSQKGLEGVKTDQGRLVATLNQMCEFLMNTGFISREKLTPGTVVNA
jgi:hypothetical protein